MYYCKRCDQMLNDNDVYFDPAYDKLVHTDSDCFEHVFHIIGQDEYNNLITNGEKNIRYQRFSNKTVSVCVGKEVHGSRWCVIGSSEMSPGSAAHAVLDYINDNVSAVSIKFIEIDI